MDLDKTSTTYINVVKEEVAMALLLNFIAVTNLEKFRSMRIHIYAKKL